MLTVIAIIGVATAFFAATIAVAQNDIKKVLAYSTVSQLGYMFLAVGSGAYVAAIFHMITHAFFKALLFLGAGSVIHGMHDEQDMRHMGALRKFLPITAVMLHHRLAGHRRRAAVLRLLVEGRDPARRLRQELQVLWFVGFVTAVLTAYYMTRQVIMVFFGEARWTRPARAASAHAATSAVGARRRADARRHADHGHAVHAARVAVDDAGCRSSCSPSAAVVGGLLNLPFAGRRATSHAVARAGRRAAASARRRQSDRGRQVAPRSPLAAICRRSCGIFLGYLVYERHRLKAGRARVPGQRLVLRPDASPRSWADPGEAAFEGRRPVRRQRHRRRGQRHGARASTRAAQRLRRSAERLRPQLRARHRRRRRAAARLVRARGAVMLDGRASRS